MASFPDYTSIVFKCYPTKNNYLAAMMKMLLFIFAFLSPFILFLSIFFYSRKKYFITLSIVSVDNNQH